MPFIGNTPQTQSFAPAVDYFSGNGVTVTFTLSRPVVSVAQLTVAVDNVIQNPSSAFTVSGNSITFTSAPLSGTNNIWVEYTSLITTYAAISQDPSVIGDISATGGYLAEGDFGNSYIDGTVVDYVTGNARITTGPIDNMTFYHGGTSGRSEMLELYYAGGAKVFGTTALTIPVGTTAQRPASPASGMTRFNSTTSTFEVYNGTVWVNYTPSYSIDYLVVAGGGGGGSTYHGAGGGAGGLLSGSLVVSGGTAYALTVGGGGSGGASGLPGAQGLDGSNSTGFSQTAIGGGGGGSYGQGPGRNGGSGGGGAQDYPAAGSGTAGQGNSGGTVSGGPGWIGGGGGGGASGVGGNGSGNNTPGGSIAGNGGAGYTWLNGNTYAGGGSGSYGTTGTAGTTTGGGGVGSNAQGGNGTANTGGGGGGSERNNPSTTAYPGGNGGSGVVIVRYLGAQRGTGGTVTSAGGYTYHTFTSSGTYTA